MRGEPPTYARCLRPRAPLLARTVLVDVRVLCARDTRARAYQPLGSACR